MSDICRHDGGLCAHLDRIQELLQQLVDGLTASQPSIDDMVAKTMQAQRELAAEIDAKRAQEHAAWHALHDQKPGEKVN